MSGSFPHHPASQTEVIVALWQVRVVLHLPLEEVDITRPTWSLLHHPSRKEEEEAEQTGHEQSNEKSGPQARTRLQAPEAKGESA